MLTKVLGYKVISMPFADFGTIKETRYKIGYVEDNTVYIASDCYEYIDKTYREVQADSLKEALCNVILLRNNYRMDCDDIKQIYDYYDCILKNNTLCLGGKSLTNLILHLKKVCDSRPWEPLREYF